MEHVSEITLKVRKRNGKEEPFDRVKLRNGIVKAAVEVANNGRLTELIESIYLEARRVSHESVIGSQELGHIVLIHLRAFNDVWHIRYALTQIGRLDRSEPTRGWRTVDDFRRWLHDTYPELKHFPAYTTLHYVVKRNGDRRSYDRKKLERSIGVASKGRGESDNTVFTFATKIADEVERELRGQAIVTSSQIAAEVIRCLRRVDHIAALRFSSTAKLFRSSEDYETEAIGLR
ncbi:ATP cone domain-containing protein [Acidithrix ferrooxidans]|uniref:ATP cone domain-containing protein n=1 Tax=Acidithrix ferrooxidans TaxID=1280514 RepID=UPI000696F34F|nr:ATP cone domain-containing protein [Acidithrix ferrooxidans]